MSFLPGTAKIYTVHIRPDEANPYEKPIFVREGFIIPAFLFTFFWTLYKRMWLATIGILIVQTILMVCDHNKILTANSVAIVQLAFQVIVGFHGNDWYRTALTRKGYITVDIVTGTSLIGAEQRYFERYLAAA